MPTITITCTDEEMKMFYMPLTIEPHRKITLLAPNDITIKTGHNNLEKKLFESFGWDKLSNNNHSTFGDKWRIINLIKRLQFIRLINYIKQKNMVIDESCLNNRFDLDYKLLSMIIDSDVS